jgi:cytochrome c oxidase cbb3-type subunit 3
MNEFVSNFWPWYIGIASILSLAACFIFLIAVTRGQRPNEEETTGHVWDEDLRELNNPLPGWWRWLFHGTIAFAVVYLVIFPGLGFWTGTQGWTQEDQYRSEVSAADAAYGPIYARYAAMDVATLADDPEARKIGRRLFLNHCTACHGSDAGGAPGYPNLRDEEWKWGGTPEAIEATITGGRQALMPNWEPSLGKERVKEVVQYVLSFTNRQTQPELVAAGKQTFETICFSCHRITATGNPAIGAPNLTNDLWQYGGSEQIITQTVSYGRKGMMPAHGDFLGPAKVRLLAAYVYGLSKGS